MDGVEKSPQEIQLELKNKIASLEYKVALLTERRNVAQRFFKVVKSMRIAQSSNAEDKKQWEEEVDIAIQWASL